MSSLSQRRAAGVQLPKIETRVAAKMALMEKVGRLHVNYLKDVTTETPDTEREQRIDLEALRRTITGDQTDNAPPAGELTEAEKNLVRLFEETYARIIRRQRIKASLKKN
jgi:hypothetical protein